MTQPNGMIGQVRSSYRIKQGDYVINKLGQSWSTRQTSFAILYYEGQEAYKHTDTDVGYYPTSFDSGQYDLRTLTYGYVMQTDPVTRQVRPIQISATRGALSNIAIRLGVGTQISMMIRFKHEQIFESLRYNSTIRARIFDDKDNLVGEWLTSSSINGTSRPFNSIGQIIKGLPSDSLPAAIGSGTSILGPGYSFAGSGSLGTQVLETVNYVPHGTDQLRITISGLPDPYATGSGALYAGYGFDRAFDVGPWGPGKFGAPGAPYGINGNPWYTGGFYVEVEVVPFGRDVENRHTRLGGSGALYDGWYPIVQGLLDGESCAADPRTGILFRWSFVPNRISPYQQRVHVPLPGAYMGGESSGVFELDLFGSAIVPVPEYPAPMIVLTSALAAVLAVMSRRKRTRHRNRFFDTHK